MFDELQASAYRCKKERSVAFKIRQMRFQPGLCPRPRGGAHNASSDSVVDWGGDTLWHLNSPTFGVCHSLFAARCLWCLGFGGMALPPKYFPLELRLFDTIDREEYLACEKLSNEVLVLYLSATATSSSLASWKSRLALTFLMIPYIGCPGKKAVKRASICLSNLNVILSIVSLICTDSWFCWLATLSKININDLLEFGKCHW